MDIEATNPVNTVRTSLEIAEGIKEMDNTTLSDISKEFEMPVSTVHNHLSTLEEMGYILKDESGEYQIGFKFLELGGHVRNQTPLYLEGKNEVDNLAKETGELVNLMVEEHGKGIHLYQAKGEKAVSFDSFAGKRVHLHCNALGKAILTHLPEQRLEAIVDYHGLPEATANTTTDMAMLKSELTKIKERGFALDDGERIQNQRCIAAPIVNDDKVLGAVSVSGPASRIKGDRFRKDLPEKVLRAADLISINISYP